jgi:hypothetical protein
MVDNFWTFACQIMEECSDDQFYVVEIIKRRKENPELKNHSQLIDVFEIVSDADLTVKSETIKSVCRRTNARAYIRVNRRGREKIALQMLKELAVRVSNHDYNCRNLYHSVLGKYASDERSKWIVDVDDDCGHSTAEIVDEILRLRGAVSHKQSCLVSIWGIVTTINGVHIIASPFNLGEFRKKFPTIDVHKDNPTLLYYGGNDE